jgi:hypothetical protein
MTDSDKHSSLLRQGIIYKLKKFYVASPLVWKFSFILNPITFKIPMQDFSFLQTVKMQNSQIICCLAIYLNGSFPFHWFENFIQVWKFENKILRLI